MSTPTIYLGPFRRVIGGEQMLGGLAEVNLSTIAGRLQPKDGAWTANNNVSGVLFSKPASSDYTGPMALAVQELLGRLKQVPYVNRYSETHGLYWQGTTPWLIRIGSAGVHAYKTATTPKDEVVQSPLSPAHLKGDPFPTLTTSGVKQLIGNQQNAGQPWGDGNNEFLPIGWAFNSTGLSAVHVSLKPEPVGSTGRVRAFLTLWRCDITLSSGEPAAATFTNVESGYFAWDRSRLYVSNASTSGSYAGAMTRYTLYNGDSSNSLPAGTHTAPIHAWYNGSSLAVVRSIWRDRTVSGGVTGSGLSAKSFSDPYFAGDWDGRTQTTTTNETGSNYFTSPAYLSGGSWSSSRVRTQQYGRTVGGAVYNEYIDTEDENNTGLGDTLYIPMRHRQGVYHRRDTSSRAYHRKQTRRSRAIEFNASLGEDRFLFAFNPPGPNPPDELSNSETRISTLRYSVDAVTGQVYLHNFLSGVQSDQHNAWVRMEAEQQPPYFLPMCSAKNRAISLYADRPISPNSNPVIAIGSVMKTTGAYTPAQLQSRWMTFIGDA